jgi:hypothetical protein
MEHACIRPTAMRSFLCAALGNKPLTLFGDGSQTRRFCYVDDFIRGLCLLATAMTAFLSIRATRTKCPSVPTHMPPISVRRPFAALAVAVVGLLCSAGAAGASPSLLLGLMDDARVFHEREDAFRRLGELRPQVLRVTLWWHEVATAQPSDAWNHGDPSYRWDRYDDIALEADARGIQLLFSIVGTPRWANGGRSWNYPPRSPDALQAFAFAAASRYSGQQVVPDASGVLRALPRVALWTAWNEPNLRFFLAVRRPRGTSYATAAGRAYARLCNAVMRGVHGAQAASGGDKVACGVTSPRQKTARTSTGPLDFLRAMKRAGARFDVYAHHPHPPIYTQRPSSIPRRPETITLGNINVLLRELGRLYGRGKKLWITEYGYQTRPPDYFGVSPRRQSVFMREAYAIAKRNRRIDMLIWFLLRDEASRPVRGVRGLPGWQSGLMYDQRTNGGAEKPAFYRFRCLAARRAASRC